MRIENAINELRGPDVTERRGQEAKRRRQTQRAGDVVEISKAARNVGSNSVNQADLNAVSDVRHDRLDAVRQRIAEGFYDRLEVRQAIADAVLEAGVVEGVQGEARQVRAVRSEMNEVSDVREDRVEQAKRKMALNFYNSASAIEGAADGMMAQLI